jgi:hypothetical protein
MKFMHVYRTDLPIDLWLGWTPEGAYFNRLAELTTPSSLYDTFSDHCSIRERAFSLARKIGWEGDIREGPYVIGLPVQQGDGGDTYIILGWKQDNNGETFIASPVELPWLGHGIHQRITD